jgi:hypothetical protein
MSPVCQLEMTLPWGFLGGVWETVRLMNDCHLMQHDRLADLFDEDCSSNHPPPKPSRGLKKGKMFHVYS